MKAHLKRWWKFYATFIVLGIQLHSILELEASMDELERRRAVRKANARLIFDGPVVYSAESVDVVAAIVRGETVYVRKCYAPMPIAECTRSVATMPIRWDI